MKEAGIGALPLNGILNHFDKFAFVHNNEVECHLTP